MAKGKKSSGTHYTSKGERSSVKSSTLKAVSRDKTHLEKMLNKMSAWKKGRKAYTLVNGKKVEMNEAFGHYKKRYGLKES